MAKIIGALLVMAGCAGISYSLNRDSRKSVELKRSLIQMLQLLESEIKYRNLNLPECFIAVADRLSGPVAVFLEELTEELKHRLGMSLSELWQDKVNQHFRNQATESGAVMKEEEIIHLCKFGAGFGFSDQTMQVSMIRQYKQQLEEEVDRAVIKMRETTRIYNTMGVLGGIFIVIMLL